MLLSLVIPFYGVERYIGECLAPLATVSPEACEILLVDDCGKDGSLEIAEAFCAEHPNARVIRRAANGGLSAARNTGLAEARGEYVFFLDSDDIPEAESILELAKEAQAGDLDIIKGRFVYMDDAGRNLSAGPAIRKTEVCTGAELFREETMAGTYEPMVWQCLYRHAFLNRHGLRMAEGLLFEDELFTTPALLLAERTMARPVNLLKYRQREGSIMSGFRNGTRWCQCYLEVCRNLAAFDAEHPTIASSQLRERIARIALSFGKNIPAYGISGEARTQTLAFIREHGAEIQTYTKMGRTLSLRSQSVLFHLSPELFVSLYGILAR